jgi:hypothetical protein
MFAAGFVMAITAAALVFLAPYDPKELGFWPYGIANLWNRPDSRLRKSTERRSGE